MNVLEGFLQAEINTQE
ncbi:Protein of unknown function [Bacillus cereus]|nr:Protein of unknown function [Bacillus cereus]